MTSYEAIIIEKVCDRHIARFGFVIIKNFIDFRHNWVNRDFSITFNYITQTVLSKVQLDILLYTYRDNMSVTEIADKLILEENIVQIIRDTAIDKLSELFVFKQLYMGKQEFAKFILDKRAEIDHILNNKNNDLLLTDIGLDNRAVNIILRYMRYPSDDVTAGTVLSSIPNLLKVYGCSYATAAHIIYKFEQANIDCTKWINALKINQSKLDELITKYGPNLDRKRVDISVH